MMLLTIPACTAACPIIIPPTMPMVCPIGAGKRKAASLIISKVISIIIASTIAENGTFSLDSAIDKNKGTGLRLKLNEIRAIYAAGKISAKKKAIMRNILKNKIYHPPSTAVIYIPKKTKKIRWSN
nr:hypothetical protein [Bacillus sp. FDAARGOS_1420]